MDRAIIITLLKAHFHPNQLHAIIIENSFYEIFEKSYEFFSNNKAVNRCQKELENITDENRLNKIIKTEHLDKNQRRTNAVFEELKNKIYNPNLELRITKYVFQQ